MYKYTFIINYREWNELEKELDKEIKENMAQIPEECMPEKACYDKPRLPRTPSFLWRSSRPSKSLSNFPESHLFHSKERFPGLRRSTQGTLRIWSMRGKPANELGVTMCFKQVDNTFLFQNEGKDPKLCFTINKLESSDNERLPFYSSHDVKKTRREVSPSFK